MAISVKSKEVGTELWSSSSHEPAVIVIDIRNALPDFLGSVKLKYVLRGLSHRVTHSVAMHAVICMFLIPMLISLCILGIVNRAESLEILLDQLHYNYLVGVLFCAFTLIYFLVRSSRRVYGVVDCASNKPDFPKNYYANISKQELLPFATTTGKNIYETMDFQPDFSKI